MSWFLFCSPLQVYIQPMVMVQQKLMWKHSFICMGCSASCKITFTCMWLWDRSSAVWLERQGWSCVFFLLYLDRLSPGILLQSLVQFQWLRVENAVVRGPSQCLVFSFYFFIFFTAEWKPQFLKPGWMMNAMWLCFVTIKREKKNNFTETLWICKLCEAVQSYFPNMAPK